ncbi:MAG: hypothetical protein AOA66_0188 [Candidatus Bathyarchaeota archaeon BA2]|nr:MAG: hypothetical protein AOA66_0188 [Candidatus Bathyarchaeota archaeon BA2]
MGKVEELLVESEDFLKAAKKEFEVALAKNDVVRIRDSAEKAWNSVVQATNALLLALTGRVPLSHHERRVMLRETEKSKPEVRDLGIRDRYMARFKVLHGETFYEGVIDIEELRLEMEKVDEYINSIKPIATR